MGRAPCCDKANVKKGPWSAEEDAKLKSYIEKNGTGGNWIALPQKIGLKRCGKSCRLRWLNYLRPNIKHGGFSEEEDNIICSLFVSIGSRWSIIASQLPGRTDNDIKNYWNTRLKKKLLSNQLHRELQTKNWVKDWDNKIFMKQEANCKQTSLGNSLLAMNFGADDNQTPYCPDCPDNSPSSLVNYTIPLFGSSSSSSSSMDNVLGFQTVQITNSQEIEYNGQFWCGMDDERLLLEPVACDASNEPSWGYSNSMMGLSTHFSSSQQYYETTRQEPVIRDGACGSVVLKHEAKG